MLENTLHTDLNNDTGINFDVYVYWDKVNKSLSGTEGTALIK